MAGDVVIRITAVDAASGVLKKIGQAATQAANEMEKASKKADKSLDQIDKKAKQTDKEMRTFERTSLAVGAALGTTAMAIINVSAAYQRQERQLAALNRLYGESGQQMIAYAETIQNTTKFSNDAARDSAIVLNTLVDNYGLATGQIEQLISRSTDLAQLHGKSLTEVSQMVSNALRGEGEYIEQIGVTLNQTFVAQQAAARGMKNFISEMTAAEQAAFRFTLLMEQTATSQGYAMETATGMRGAIGLMINTFGDGAQAVGGMLGPVRDLAGEFQNYALWMPLIGSQIGRMFAVIKTSVSTGTAAAGAMTALRFAMSPLGLIIGATAIAVGVLGNKFLQNKQAAAQLAAQNEMAAQSYKNLEQAISSMYSSGDINAAKFSQTQAAAAKEYINVWQEAVSKGLSEDQGGFADSIESGMGSLFSGLTIDGSALGQLTGGISEYFKQAGTTFNREALEAMQISPAVEAQIYNSLGQVFQLSGMPGVDLSAFKAEWDSFFAQLVVNLGNGDLLPENVAAEIDAWAQDMAMRLAVGAAEIQQSVDELERAFEMRDLSLDGWSDAAIGEIEIFDQMSEAIFQASSKLSGLSEEYGSFSYLLTPVDTSALQFTSEQTALLETSFKSLRELMMSGDFDNPAINDAITELGSLFISGAITADQYTKAVMSIAKGIDDYALSTSNGIAAAKALGQEMDASREKMRENLDAVKEENAARQEEMIAAATQAIEEFNEARSSFLTSYYEAFQMDDPVSKINLSSLRNEFTGLAGDVANAASQLETVFRVVVENTNAIASQAQGAQDWADGLFEVVDGASKIGDLLANNFINQTQYNDALAAQGDIQASNAHIQRDVLTIQAMQAPLIAEATAAVEAQMDTLSRMPIEQQRVTLGWMDSQTAAQAYTLMTQAAQVATGELGAVGEGAFKSMIEGAVAVNPLLFDMLETIGLVSGTPLDFKVNLDGVTEGMSEIERLTMSIDALIVQLGGMPPDIKLGVQVDGEEKISSVMAKINEWGGLDNTNVKVGVEVDNEGLANFQSIVNNLTNSKPIAVQAKIEISESNAGLASFQSIVNNLMNVEPVKVPAQLDLAGSIEDPEPIVVPVTYDVSAADLPTIEPIVVQVSFNIDASAITNAMAEWSMGGEVAGPIVRFSKEDGEVHMALGDWQAVGAVSGPIIRFDSDAAIPQASLDRWTGMGAVSGPIITFDKNTQAPQEALAHWNYMGTVTGPIVKFTANTSEVTSALQAFSGTRVIGTRVVDVVTRNRTVNFGGGPNERHGGIPGMAHGGILIHAAENNQPEIATFANGGTSRLSQEGNYMVPPHTLITPSNVHRGASTGVTVNIQTGDWYGGSRPDLDEWAADGLIPAIAEELRRDERASGRAA